MACFPEDENPVLDQEISEPSSLTDIIIFHSLKKFQLDQIMLTIRLLLNLKCISVEKFSLSVWYTKFLSSVLQKSTDHFKCKGVDLQNLREDVIRMNLQYCKETVGKVVEETCE